MNFTRKVESIIDNITMHIVFPNKHRRFNAFSLYSLIGPPYGLNLGSRTHEFQNISKELHEHYNHAFSIFFSIIYGSREDF